MSRAPGSRARWLVPTCALALAGCEWVDSTGAQGDELPAADSLVVTLDDVPLEDSELVNEQSSPRVRVPAPLEGEDALTYGWQDAPLAEGPLDGCAGLPDFAAERAPDTLEEACTSADDCELGFARVGGVGAETLFELDVPSLRAPIGRRHALIGVDATGAEAFRREVDFCLVAINEAPFAMDDSYVLVEGDVLDVGAGSGVLVNDEDDVDTGNAPLAVDEVPEVAPGNAVAFELRADGSFTYEATADLGGADVEDSFVYAVTDGLQSSSATVRLRVVVADRAPVPADDAPAITGRVGEFLRVDLSDRFTDPEGERLTFEFAEGLPAGGSLALASDGTLSGVPGAADEGAYVLTLLADDGTSTASAPVELFIEPAPLPVGPVFVTGTVFDQELRLGRNIVAVEPIFESDGGTALSYASAGDALPRGVVVDPDTGRVAGRPRRRGTYDGLVVEAVDANGAPSPTSSRSWCVGRGSHATARPEACTGSAHRGRCRPGGLSASC